MAHGALPLAVLLHLAGVAAANRAPGVPAPQAPGIAQGSGAWGDLHLLADLESHWILCGVAALLLVVALEQRPEFIFGPSKAAHRSLEATSGSGSLFRLDEKKMASMRQRLKEVEEQGSAVPVALSRDIGVGSRDAAPVGHPTAADIGPFIQSILTVLTPIAKLLLQMLIWLLILLSPLLGLLYQFLCLLPKNVLRMIYGLVLCFFGGTFVATIAAAEAFMALGGQKTIPDFQLVIQEFYHAWVATGEPAGQLGGSARDRALFMMAVIERPEDLQTSLGACTGIVMAVLSTLRFQFAKTSALAVGIANILKEPCVAVFEPGIKYCLGPAIGHWASTFIDIALKSVALSIAWYVQKGVSAFYSGIRGGTMCVYGLMRLLQIHGKEPSHFDEFLGYPLAAYGFYVQVTNFFTLPYPWNIALLPLELTEWGLEWAITYKS